MGGLFGISAFVLSFIVLFLQYQFEKHSSKGKQGPFKPANFTPLIFVMALAMATWVYGGDSSPAVCCVNFVFLFLPIYLLVIIWGALSRGFRRMSSRSEGK